TRFSRDWSSDVCSSDLSVRTVNCSLISSISFFIFKTDENAFDVSSKTVQLSSVNKCCGKYAITASPGAEMLPRVGLFAPATILRSEERRVGKGGRSQRY